MGALTGEEEERKTSPSLSVSFWGHVLRNTGFTGLDYELRDCEDEEFYNFSVILTTADSEARVYHSDVVLVCSSDMPPAEWISETQAQLATILGAPPRLVTLGSMDVQGKTCIYLGDLMQTILLDMDESRFAAVKTMATTCESLLWVTRGGAMQSENPYAALSHGFLRTLKHEYPGKKFVTLDVDSQRSPWTFETTTSISRVFAAAFNLSASTSTAMEMEYCERQGAIQVPRLFTDKVINDEITTVDMTSGQPAMEAFTTPEKPVKLHIESQGLLDSLVFIDDSESRSHPLPSDYIEVSPKAFGLNFRDIMVAMGQIGIDSLHASECSGVIMHLGSEAVEQGFQVGDRVSALLLDSWTSLPRTHWSRVAKISGNVSFEVAAATPVTYATAYISLYEVARLQKGESVLIHSAAGGLGQAAIRLSQRVGADIYVTVGSKRKREFITETFGIPDSNIFSSRNASFSSDIMERTGGKGVDVVLNSLAGSLLQESFNCLSEFGRFVELGKRDFEQNSQLDMGTFRRNTTFYSVDLLAWEARRPEVVSRVLKDIIRLLEERSITAPEPITTYPISRVQEAFRSMQRGQHLGKLVITVDDTDLVPVGEPKETISNTWSANSRFR